MCIYSYILREEQLNLFSFVTPFPRIPGSPKSLDAELGMSQSSANTESRQHRGHSGTDHQRKEDEGAQVEQYLTNQVQDAQPVTKTNPGLATAPSSLAVFKGMWWITSPLSPWDKEKQRDEETLANRLSVPGVNNINRLPAIY